MISTPLNLQVMGRGSDFNSVIMAGNGTKDCCFVEKHNCSKMISLELSYSNLTCI